MQFDSLVHRELVLGMIKVCAFKGDGVLPAVQELTKAAAFADCGTTPEEIILNRNKIFQKPIIMNQGANNGN